MILQPVIYYTVLTFARLVYGLLWWPRLIGRDRLPKESYLICANHRSWFDPPLVAILHNRQIGFLAKAELFSNSLVGWFLRTLNAQPIRRGAIDRAAIRGVMDKLERGLPVIVFPEGTRSRTGQMLPPRPGVGMLARQAGVPVVPAYIVGSFGVGRQPFLWGRLAIRIGPTIRVEEIAAFPDDKQGYRDLTDRIMRAICDLSDDPATAWAQSQASS
ncbi:MAG: 1-acyl-sn-glycerol-3-phosphate acyltransferase [candidate division Zixibacteria bacterium]|nr:1-acyl-sn-glycerol-3-phosphate acyltransferase [candidate division Zixibacteria bacterium]